MTITISLSNHKGGVGKTTSTLNIGAALAKKNYKVLLLDLDPQANLSQSCGIRNYEFNINYFFRNTNSPILTKEVKNNLYIIPGSLDLSLAELELSSEPGREYILKDIIDPIKKNYDFILIDCPPSLSLLTINALTISDTVLIPLQAEYLPVAGLSTLNNVINKVKKRLNQQLTIGGVFFTQFDNRKILNRSIMENVKELFKDALLETKISNNISLAEAPSKGMDIFSYSSTSKGAIEYLALTKEILEKINLNKLAA